MTRTMFPVNIDRSEPVALHDQVAAQIRRAIADGEAGPGERLPLVKDIAAVLGVNKNTVLRAMHILRDEGLLEFRRGRGITVAGTPERSAVLGKVQEMVAFARHHGYRPQEVIEMIESLSPPPSRARGGAACQWSPTPLVEPIAKRRGSSSRRPAVEGAVRWAVIGALLVVAAITVPVFGLGVGGTSGGHDKTLGRRSPQGSSAGSSGHGVVVIDNDAMMTLVDFSTGTSKTATLPHKGGGDSRDALLATGGFFVYPGDGGTWAIPLDLSGSPRLLGPASYVVPSATAGRVWLVTTTSDRGQPVSITVREVEADGRSKSPLYRVPAGFGPISGVAGGLVLVDTIAGGSVVWDPVTQHFGTRFPGPNVGNLVDVRGSMVAWGVGCSANSICTSLRLTDVRNGRSRDYPAPHGTVGWVSTGGEGSRDAFSSDGRYLAVRAAHGASQLSPSDVYVLNVSSGATFSVPDASPPYPYSRVAWLPNSPWVVFASGAGSVNAYRVQDGQRRSFLTPCCGVALLALAG